MTFPHGLTMNTYKPQELEDIVILLDQNGKPKKVIYPEQLDPIHFSSAKQQGYAANSSLDTAVEAITSPAEQAQNRSLFFERMSSIFMAGKRKYITLGATLFGGVTIQAVGCIGPGVPEVSVPEAYDISNVPFEEQHNDTWCLPACGQMDLNYLGFPVTQEELAHYIISDGKGDPYKLLDYVKDNLGLEGDSKWLSLDKVKELINQDIPLIVAKRFSFTDSNLHSILLIGYDDNSSLFKFHDPYVKNGGPNKKISYSDLLSLADIYGLGKYSCTYFFPAH